MNFSRETSPLLDGFLSAVERAIESPKTTIVASTATATAGTAMSAQWITGAFGMAATMAGITATVFLIRVHWLKGEQHKLEIEHQRMENKILRRKAQELGLTIEEE